MKELPFFKIKGEKKGEGTKLGGAKEMPKFIYKGSTPKGFFLMKSFFGRGLPPTPQRKSFSGVFLGKRVHFLGSFFIEKKSTL